MKKIKFTVEYENKEAAREQYGITYWFDDDYKKQLFTIEQKTNKGEKITTGKSPPPVAKHREATPGKSIEKEDKKSILEFWDEPFRDGDDLNQVESKNGFWKNQNLTLKTILKMLTISFLIVFIFVLIFPDSAEAKDTLDFVKRNLESVIIMTIGYFFGKRAWKTKIRIIILKLIKIR